MKRLAVHIFVVVALSSCLVACGRRVRVIPRNKLAAIYAELYAADQWSDSEMKYRLAADTTAFYETILKSYGYTSADYRASVDRYLKDPERFSRILKKSSTILQAESDKMNVSVNELQDIQDLIERARKLAPKYERLEHFVWEISDSSGVGSDTFVDSMIVKNKQDSICVDYSKNMPMRQIRLQSEDVLK